MEPESLTSPIRHVVNRLIIWGADGVYFLTVLCVLALSIRVVAGITKILWFAPSYAAMLSALDPLLLLLMLAELLHTVALTLQNHHLPLRPLLALIFIAVLRHGVVLASTMSLASWNAGATLLGILALSFLLAQIPPQNAD
ncbi:phosphate-starvation-inducible PsiE family protein [Sulfobacillus thermosulfidooxidans]|uniref:phosphate-starvation-inducible PsiE family protein n=1 Tax=Sulfobacillus thermosulfidooxidans TaxID=28034 RepID=UPI0006B5C15C|nr:phosphate-starvation-inducible PsiE family protein [Sulfobacillus thermosulfidooxidans]